MKNLLFLLSLIGISAIGTSSPQKVDLATAIKSGLIQANALSNGQYHDESVMLNVRNLKNTRYIIRIPPTSLFHPSDAGEQSLITTEEQFLVVDANGTASKLLKAYCTEPEDRCPSAETAFSMEQSTHPALQKLSEYVGSHPVSQSCMQDAIWAIVDGRPISNIVAETPADNAFRKYLSELVGKENPWYTSPQNRVIQEDGNIVSSTVKIDGELLVDIAKDCKMYQEIRDKNGNSKLKGQRLLTMPKGENIRFKFHIEVTGWQKGDYDVFLLTEQGQELARYSFSV